MSGKEVGAKKIEFAERHLKRLDFWDKLLEKSAKITPLFNNIKPKKDTFEESLLYTSKDFYAETSTSSLNRIKNLSYIKQAIIMSEILGKPKGFDD